jgi:hypothetical protein
MILEPSQRASGALTQLIRILGLVICEKCYNTQMLLMGGVESRTSSYYACLILSASIQNGDEKSDRIEPMFCNISKRPIGRI